MRPTILVLDEIGKVNESKSVLCESGSMQCTAAMDHLPRKGSRDYFVFRDGEQVEAVYRVVIRRSDWSEFPHPVVLLAMVRSSGTPEQVELALLKAGFRPTDAARRLGRSAAADRMMSTVHRIGEPDRPAPRDASGWLQRSTA